MVAGAETARRTGGVGPCAAPRGCAATPRVAPTTAKPSVADANPLILFRLATGMTGPSHTRTLPRTPA